ncbi:MAG: two-component sensor histidine kinase [Desulfamplus sp.]|nr:two-component sensor histidine kinase [Desulfamplus sp.]
MINNLEIQRGLKWLISFRILFAIILIFSTLVFSTNESLPFDAIPFVLVYFLSLFILLLSVIYGLLFKKFSTNPIFAYIQLTIDSFTVSAIIFITGGFQSIFTFIYLMVIITASVLLYRKGSLIIATLCSLQYGILIDLEYYGFIAPLVTNGHLSAQVAWNHIIYRIVIVITACFSVAVLSGFLAIQSRIAKKELKLMEDHLKRVQKMATMGELAAGMAHEIKNPLASLSGAIQMLKEDSKPGTPNHKLMQIVLRETERLSRIVTDFLLFAKPSIKTSKEINISHEIEDTVRLFKQDAICRDNSSSEVDLSCSREIEFEMNLDDSLSIKIDSDHFRQILWNLIKNSAESIHTKRANYIQDSLDSSEYIGWIGIDLFKIKDGRILLKVSDNGCGIDQNDIDSVFNPFFTTKSYGTGLGLSIIHRLVDSYQGFIDVESKLGMGTTFTVLFK